MMRRFLTHWQNVLGLLLVSSYIVMAVFAPQIAPPTDPQNPDVYKFIGPAIGQVPQPPSAKAPWGTALIPVGPTRGLYAIDVFYSVVWGARSALQLGLTAAVATAIFGTLIGAFSGYLGGLVNSLTLRITDAFLTIPLIAGVWLIGQVFFPPYSVFSDPPPIRVLMEGLGLNPVIVGFILFSWMPYARLINANVARLKTVDFILASQVLGVGKLQMIFKHLLPNTLSPAIVLLARDIGGMVILEAAFTFIGMGLGNVWGEVLVENRSWIVGAGGDPFVFWWVYIPMTLALIFFGVGWNLLGDGLNDVLNPRET